MNAIVDHTAQVQILDLGTMPYREAWNLQLKYKQEVLDAKAARQPVHERILIVEHPPVYTLGFHGNASNMLVSEEWLNKRGIELVRIERGGDITFHGPGQIVMYPILDLEMHGLGIKTYVELLEQSVIDALKSLNINSGRVEGATGVWVNIGTANESKICAIGVKCSHFVTMHGLALNVNTNLSYFNAINPCGFTNRGVTSIEQLLGSPADLPSIKSLLASTLLSLLPANPSP